MAYRWMVLLCALSPGTRPAFGGAQDLLRQHVRWLVPAESRRRHVSRWPLAPASERVEAAASVIMDRALGVLSMLLVAIAALAYAHEMIAMPGVLPTVVLVAAGCLVGAAAIYSERVAALAVRAATLLPVQGQGARRRPRRCRPAARATITN